MWSERLDLKYVLNAFWVHSHLNFELVIGSLRTLIAGLNRLIDTLLTKEQMMEVRCEKYKSYEKKRSI